MMGDTGKAEDVVLQCGGAATPRLPKKIGKDMDGYCRWLLQNCQIRIYMCLVLGVKHHPFSSRIYGHGRA